MNYLRTILPLLMLFLVASCNSDSPIDDKDKVSRTVLVYMIATNSLQHHANNDIAEMMEGIVAVNGDDCHLLLYEVNYNDDPTLYEIANINGSASKTKLKSYSSNIRSTTVERMYEVMSDTRSFAPADSYGLVLWSHGTGWVRTLEDETVLGNHSIGTLDYGIDYDSSMSITQLAEALPDGMFDFIYADVCYMGCVEVAYQLRNKTAYFISSPTETMAAGMPYNKNVPCFFEKVPNLTQACMNTYNYYATSGSYATISLVDCSKLDALASLCHEIHANPSGMVDSTDGLQYYNRNTKPIYFDFLQYTTLLASQQQAAELYTLTNQAVVYKAATSRFISITIDPDNFSGLSTYILGTSSPVNEEYYTTLDWYQEIYN